MDDNEDFFKVKFTDNGTHYVADIYEDHEDENTVFQVHYNQAGLPEDPLTIFIEKVGEEWHQINQKTVSESFINALGKAIENEPV